MVQSTSDERATKIVELVSFLQRGDITTYFTIHPNQLSSPLFEVPNEWSVWWNWTDLQDIERDGEAWLPLWRYYTALPDSRESEIFGRIPERLRAWIDVARSLQISRAPIPESQLRRYRSPSGMSPKKQHEVARMTAYISKLSVLLSTVDCAPIEHVVDIGAGQAYLSRALRDYLHADVLALDWSDVQFRGAVKKEAAKDRGVGKAKDSPHLLSTINPEQTIPHLGSLTYKTMTINTESLITATTQWLASGATAESAPVPVLLVALHACGSLTLDILRALATQYRSSLTASSSWTPRAALVVGCCYNMLRVEDRVLQCDAASSFVLSTNHLQLAAQTPSQWGLTPKKFAEARLAVRKVAWRSLLEPLISRQNGVAALSQTSPSGQGDYRGRLGKLNNVAYADWDTFMAAAQQKLGKVSDQSARTRDQSLESRISVFHVLRSMLGPIVEGLILLDRQQWLENELCNTGLGVELVNLFDQSAGSGRNVAILVKPLLPGIKVGQ